MKSKIEVAEYLRVSEMTVNRMMKDGRLPYIKIGKTVRFREEDLEAIRKDGALGVGSKMD